MTEHEEKKTLEVQNETEKRNSETSMDEDNEVVQNSEMQLTSEKENGNIDQFAGLPMEELIAGPIIAAAKGQRELVDVYTDQLKKIAYKEETNTLDFTYSDKIITQGGRINIEGTTIKAPLLSIVPVPAFTMDDLTVDFNMEVKSKDDTLDKTHEDVSSTVKYNSWFGMDVSITGKVSSDTERKRQTEKSEIYSIDARTIQQSPSEGMEKLTSLLEQTTEANNTKK